MTTQQLNFIKTGYNTVDAAKAASLSLPGAIIFDKAHRVICVDGEVFGGNIANVQWVKGQYDATEGTHRSKLVITYADGTSQETDFSDVASASEVVRAFEQIQTAIGTVKTSDHGQIDYTGANYVEEQTSLQGADMVLDAKIKNINDRIGEADAADVTYSGTNYLGDTNTLKAADAELDRKVKQVKDQIGNATDDVNTIDYGTDRYLGTNDGAVSAQVSTLKGADERLSEVLAQVADNTKEYKIVKKDVANDDFMASYKLQFRTSTNGTAGEWQDDTNGVEINIPKDFLVKGARVVTVVDNAATPGTNQMTVQAINTAAGRSGADSFAAGDRVMEFTINTKADGDETVEDNTYLYLGVEEMFDSYTSADAEGNTTPDYAGAWATRTGAVTVIVDQANNKLSATVKPSAITGAEINDNVVSLDEGRNTTIAGGDTTDSSRAAGEIKVNNGESVTLVTIQTNSGAQEVKAQVNLYWTVWDNNNVPNS